MMGWGTGESRTHVFISRGASQSDLEQALICVVQNQAHPSLSADESPRNLMSIKVTCPYLALVVGGAKGHLRLSRLEFQLQ